MGPCDTIGSSYPTEAVKYPELSRFKLMLVDLENVLIYVVGF